MKTLLILLEGIAWGELASHLLEYIAQFAARAFLAFIVSLVELVISRQFVIECQPKHEEEKKSNKSPGDDFMEKMGKNLIDMSNKVRFHADDFNPHESPRQSDVIGNLSIGLGSGIAGLGTSAFTGSPLMGVLATGLSGSILSSNIKTNNEFEQKLDLMETERREEMRAVKSELESLKNKFNNLDLQNKESEVVSGGSLEEEI